MSEQTSSSSAHKGKLIVIEGTDGSGKRTQTAKLLERLLQSGATMFKAHDESSAIEDPELDPVENSAAVAATATGAAKVFGEPEVTQTQGVAHGKVIETIDFPRYNTPSCYMVEKYLNGAFGTAMEVGPYVGSMFYAVDRYDHSFDMRKKLDAGTILISDRYVSASMGHQAGKIDDLAERDTYLEWLSNLEYEIFKIPRPDVTILLYVDPVTNQRLIASKPDRDYIKEGKKADIHEADLDHLKKASEAFLYVARKFGWTVIDCAPKTEEHPEGALLSIEEVHEMIWREVSKVI